MASVVAAGVATHQQMPGDSTSLANTTFTADFRREDVREELQLASAIDAVRSSHISDAHKEKLSLLLSNPEPSSREDTLRLAQAVNKLCRSDSCVAAKTLTREEIITSVLESVAEGARELRQGNMATCTATAAGKLYINQKGIGAYAELMANLVMDGRHDFDNDPTRRLRLYEDGIRNELDKGKFEGASIAECVFRTAMMQLSCEGLQLADPRMQFSYDDPSGITYIFDRDSKPVGSFTGMHRDGWIYSMEKMFGCGVEFLSSTSDKDGSYKAKDILQQLSESEGGACIELSYAERGAHSRHFCEFSHVADGRVYFDNPHALNEANFKAKSASHRLESNGLESMSIADFEARLLSASIVREGTECGAFQESNESQQGWRSVESITNWFLENPHSHIEFHISVAYLAQELLQNKSILEGDAGEHTLVRKKNLYGIPVVLEEDLSPEELTQKQKNEQRARERLLQYQHMKARESLFDVTAE
ncbi:MAG: hypothetical protein ACO3XO_00530 [Bdellovibrionota bacterium]